MSGKCIVLPYTVRRWRRIHVGTQSQHALKGVKNMSTAFKESQSTAFISERLEEQLSEIRQKLENMSRYECVYASIAEDICEIKRLLNNKDEEDFLTCLSKSFGRVSLSLSSFADRHKARISHSAYEELKLKAYDFKIAENVFEVSASQRFKAPFRDSLKNLKELQRRLDIYAELADSSSFESVPPGLKFDLKVLANWALKTTSKRYDTNPKKEKVRKAIRHSASFIVHQVAQFTQSKELNFVVGQLPHAKLLEETKKRLHMLDLLSPSNNEEAAQQRKIREHLIEVFGD